MRAATDAPLPLHPTDQSQDTALGPPLTRQPLLATGAGLPGDFGLGALLELGFEDGSGKVESHLPSNQDQGGQRSFVLQLLAKFLPVSVLREELLGRYLHVAVSGGEGYLYLGPRALDLPYSPNPWLRLLRFRSFKSIVA